MELGGGQLGASSAAGLFRPPSLGDPACRPTISRHTLTRSGVLIIQEFNIDIMGNLKVFCWTRYISTHLRSTQPRDSQCARDQHLTP